MTGCHPLSRILPCIFRQPPIPFLFSLKPPIISASPAPHSTGTGHHSWPVCGSVLFDPEDGDEYEEEDDDDGDFGVDGVTEGFGVVVGDGVGISKPFFGAAETA